MNAFVTAVFALVGLVNLLPLVGVLSRQRIEALYGVAVDGPDLAILLRHRAVLLGIVGGLLVAAAAWPELRPTALIVGLVSMLSFVAVAVGVGGYNAALRRVLWVDVVASVGLAVVGGLG